MDVVVRLFGCPEHNLETNDPTVFKFGPLDILEMTWF